MSVTRTLLRGERRSANTVNWWGFDWTLSDVTAAGESVTPPTALGITAYFAAIRAISEDVAKLPLGVYEELEGGGRRRVADHPVDYLVHTEPNPEMSSMAFREALMQHALGWGNGYAEIIRDGRGVPRELWPLDPTTVSVLRVGGELVYEVHVPPQEPVRLPAARVLHIHGLGADAYTGYGLARLAREALGAILASQKFAAAFYGNGTWLGGVLQHPAALSDTAQKHLRETFEARHGGAENAMRVAVLEEGVTYQQFGVQPDQAQFIETRQFGVEEVARLFRIPPHKIQHLLRSTYSNIEQQSLEYVGDTLMPWIVRWEQEIRRKLFLPTERTLFVKHNITSLLRADAASRGAFYSQLFNIGGMSINDMREKEDMNPIEGGDTHFVPVNMVPLERALNPTEPGGPEPPQPEGDEGAERAALEQLLEAHAPALADAIERLLRVERDKAVRAEKRGNLSAWADEFYAAHGRHVCDVVRPLLLSFAQAARMLAPGREITADTEAFATRHVRRSLRDVQAGGAAMLWANRAREQAREELELMIGADNG